MIVGIYLAALFLTIANWILIPIALRRSDNERHLSHEEMSKKRKLILITYLPTAIIFSIFSVLWAVHYNIPA